MQLEFLLGTQIKPGSPSGAVCAPRFVLIRDKKRNVPQDWRTMDNGQELPHKEWKRREKREPRRSFWSAFHLVILGQTSSPLFPELFKHVLLSGCLPYKNVNLTCHRRGLQKPCVRNALRKHRDLSSPFLRNLALAGQRLQAVLHVLERKWANKTASWPSVRYIIRG